MENSTVTKMLLRWHLAMDAAAELLRRNVELMAERERLLHASADEYRDINAIANAIADEVERSCNQDRSARTFSSRSR
jgi:hypothetical protein